MKIYCEDCDHVYNVKEEPNRRICKTVGYCGEKPTPYYIQYYKCKCGNNIVLFALSLDEYLSRKCLTNKPN